MWSIRSEISRAGVVFAALAASVAPASARLENGPAIEIHRLSAPIEIDGDLTDTGWAAATRVETWWEINPGDNVEPEVGNVAWLAYDDEYLYAAFEFERPRSDGDPRPARRPRQRAAATPTTAASSSIRAATARRAQMFLANARGIQYDAISSDATRRGQLARLLLGERRTHHRGRLAARDPHPVLVDSLHRSEPRHWGILLYRNHPRDYRYQYFTLASAARARTASSATCAI